MTNGIIGYHILDYKISEILYEFKIMYEGWQLDEIGYVVKMENGKKAIVETDHGMPVLSSIQNLQDKIKEYESAIKGTQKAIKIVSRGDEILIQTSGTV
jgi:uncharacterized protein YlzI (FlbEa/FlbD family)